MTARQSGEVLGRREQNKRDKVLRIREAARALLAEDGYDEATTRRIANRANVALGTLFLYADDKRDILFLVVNEDLERCVAVAEQQILGARTLADKLIAVFRSTYELCAAQPQLMRLVLREVTFYEQGKQAQHYMRTRDRLIKLATRMVREAVEQGQIAPQENPDYIGWGLFALMQAEIRSWLRDDQPDVKKGLRKLRRAFALILANLANEPIPAKAKQRARRSGARAKRAIAN